MRVTITLPPPRQTGRVLTALAASVALHAGLACGLYSFGLTRVNLSPHSGAPAMGVASDLALAMQGLKPALVATPASMPTPPEVAVPVPPPDRVELPAQPQRAERGPVERPRTEIEVTPGIDKSDADTPNWLGAAQGTEHKAVKSVTDQPAMSRDPGKRGNDDAHEGQATPAGQTTTDSAGKGDGSGTADGAGAGVAGEDTPQGQDAQKETAEAQQGRAGSPSGVEDATSQHGTTPRDARDARTEQSASEQPTPPKPLDETGLMPEQAPVDPTPPTAKVDAVKPEKPAVTAIDPRAASDASVLGAPVPTSEAGGREPSVRPGSESRIPGTKSDAESPASSREISAKFRPGTPFAHEGLRIRPKLPRYTMTTRAMSRPVNPLVVIKFNRAGKVVKAEFAPGRTTGSTDWDAPLLASLYEWTATGKKLQELPTSDPDAVLVLKLEYLLSE